MVFDKSQFKGTPPVDNSMISHHCQGQIWKGIEFNGRMCDNRCELEGEIDMEEKVSGLGQDKYMQGLWGIP